MLKQLLDLQGQKRLKVKQINDLTMAESRTATDAEFTELDGILRELQTLETQIETARSVQAIALSGASPVDTTIQQGVTKKEAKEIRSFSFQRAIMAERLDGIELEMHQEGVRNLEGSGRSISGIIVPELVLSASRVAGGNLVGIAGDGGNTVYPEYKGFKEFFKNALVMEALGATVITGLKGDLSYITETSQIKATWEGEIATASTAKPTFANLVSRPVRLSKVLLYSLRLLNQSVISVESTLQKQIAYALAFALQDAALVGVTTTDASQSIVGILNDPAVPTVSMGANGGLFTYAKAVEMETSVATRDALVGNLAYLTNAAVRGALKTTQKFSNSQASDTIMTADGQVNGYNTALTNYIPSNLVKGTSGAVCSAMVFGDFSQLEFHRFGGIELIVDRITAAADGQVKLVVNDFANVLNVRPTSFAKCLDIKTS